MQDGLSTCRQQRSRTMVKPRPLLVPQRRRGHTCSGAPGQVWSHDTTSHTDVFLEILQGYTLFLNALFTKPVLHQIKSNDQNDAWSST